jgi:hypothetical protein
LALALFAATFPLPAAFYHSRRVPLRDYSRLRTEVALADVMGWDVPFIPSWDEELRRWRTWPWKRHRGTVLVILAGLSPMLGTIDEPSFAPVFFVFTGAYLGLLSYMLLESRLGNYLNEFEKDVCERLQREPTVPLAQARERLVDQEQLLLNEAARVERIRTELERQAADVRPGVILAALHEGQSVMESGISALRDEQASSARRGVLHTYGGVLLGAVIGAAVNEFLSQ